MADLKKLQEKVVEFRNKRDWAQFHKPKDLAISLSLEAGEVLEHFQWKNEEELEEYLKTNKKELGEELSDVLNYTLLLSHELDIDLEKSFLRKLGINAKKYPVKKAKGKATKYNKL